MQYLYLLVPQGISLIASISIFVIFIRVQSAVRKGVIEDSTTTNLFLLHSSIHGVIKQICGICTTFILSFTDSTCNTSVGVIVLGYIYTMELLTQIGWYIAMLHYVLHNTTLDAITNVTSPLSYIRQNKAILKISLSSAVWTGIWYVIYEHKYNKNSDYPSELAKYYWCDFGTSLKNQENKYSQSFWLVLFCVPIWFSVLYELALIYKIMTLSSTDSNPVNNPYDFDSSLDLIRKNKQSIIRRYLYHPLEILIVYFLPTFAIFGGGNQISPSTIGESSMSTFQYFCLFLLQFTSVINLFLCLTQSEIQSLLFRKNSSLQKSDAFSLPIEMTNVPTASISSFS